MDQDEERVALPAGFCDKQRRAAFHAGVGEVRWAWVGEAQTRFPFYRDKGGAAELGNIREAGATGRGGISLPYHWSVSRRLSTRSFTCKLAQILGVGFCRDLLERSAGGAGE